ncbi:MAG: type II secretion system F family protein [Natronomonas sp.]
MVLGVLSSYLPLLVGLAILSIIPLARVSDPLESRLARIALFVFGSYADRPSEKRTNRIKLIRASGQSTMYRSYASQTYLYSAIAALGGGLTGLYLLIGFLRVLAIPEEVLTGMLPDSLSFVSGVLALPTLTTGQFLLLLIVSGGVVGGVLGLATFYYRWNRISRTVDRRELMIDESLPRTVAFMYALSRGGLSQKELTRILSENASYFGEAAEEFKISLRYIDYSNADFLSATRELARVTPSEEFSNFAEDLSSVLQSGRPASEFFREEYEQYKQQKESNQERILEQISALAEVYVSLLVAGPLFLITILVIIGLIVGGTLPLLQALVYVIVPGVSIVFMYYVGNLALSLGIDADADDFRIDTDTLTGKREADDSVSLDEGAVRQPDGGVPDGSNPVSAGRDDTRYGPTLSASQEQGWKQLQAYDRVRSIHEKLTNPVETVLRSPTTLLYVTVPIALAYVVARSYVAATSGQLRLPVVDDYVIQAGIFVLTTFAVAQFFYEQRLQRINRALPDFIDRLADKTEAGLTLHAAIKSIDPDSIPGMSDEIEKTRTDLEWGARTTEALARLSHRSQSVFVSRAVVLMSNALRASKNIAPVLRIAADEAQLDRRLKKKQREEILIYQVIIYISFFVFLAIIASLSLQFIPNIPTGEAISPGESVPDGGEQAPTPGGIGDIGGADVDIDAYQLVLFHSIAVQGVLGGLVAGKMATGSAKSGAKHAAVMLTVAYAAIVLIQYL